MIVLCMGFTVCGAFAQEERVLVLPDNVQFESTNYYVYPDSSILFASEVIDYLNHSGKVQTVKMEEVRKALRSDLKLFILTKNTLKEYKYNYNISFVDLRNIAKTFSVDKILLITSTTDVQNYVLRRTVWDILNIPGASVIDPVYKMTTFAAFVDVKEEKVLWQQTYRKNLGSMENRIIAVNFAPALEQLDKLKLYSSVLSPEIARHVENGMSLTIVPTETTAEPVNQITEPASPPPTMDLVDIKKKPFTPITPRAKSNGSMINDL